MATSDILEGVFAINKPTGLSSAQVIRDAQAYFQPSALFAPMLAQERANRQQESKSSFQRRKKAKQVVQVKMGHGGTLDPLARGVLILGVGKGTKSLQDFLLCTKTYETVVLFGASTDTYDRCGRIVKKGRYDEVTRPAVEKALESFRGRFLQMPPLYSALKMNGKPLYEYARENKAIPREIPTREVDVTEMELVEWYEPGTHEHRWPTEEAEESEKNVVNSVWQVARRQTASQDEPRKLTPEEEQKETRALEAYESTKRKAEERVDNLVYDSGESPGQRQHQGKGSAKRRKKNNEEPVMSGALGELPAGRGSNLVPPPPAADTPPPWEGKGPPAARIRMTVTSGFYVRSLCHDLGEKLGCGAMMAELSRTRQGEFALGGENCLEYEDLAKGEEIWGPKVTKMLASWTEKPLAPTSGTQEQAPSKRSTKQLSNSSVLGKAAKALSRGQVSPSSALGRTTQAQAQEQSSRVEKDVKEESSSKEKVSDKKNGPDKEKDSGKEDGPVNEDAAVKEDGIAKEKDSVKSNAPVDLEAAST